MMNLKDVPPERLCGAKTRTGAPCKNRGIWPSGRCRMHGGKSYGGMASPTLKHGWYSRYWPYTTMRRRIEIQERTDRYVAARMEEIRAERAKQEAREKVKADELRQLFEREGDMILLNLCTSECGADDDKSTCG